MNFKELDNLLPKDIVKELDNYIVGQYKAKRSVAIALRNRYRRQQLPQSLRDEVTPKNIIMVGSTGIGKTEIARRIAKITNAPFIKVEATKYTEVGYVGRDVESMIRELLTIAINSVKKEFEKDYKQQAYKKSINEIVKILVKSKKDIEEEEIENDTTANYFLQKIENGEMDDKEIEIKVKKNSPYIDIIGGSMGDEINSGLAGITSFLDPKKTITKKTTIKKAKEILIQSELDKLVDMDQVIEIAKHRVETMGIVFIDEIDKIATRSESRSADVSREGVQRDILPIIEGSSVSTKYGIINTTHILFIAAGAFHISKVSDLMPELQGRFPIRVELEDLSEDDFFKILTNTKNSLILQYKELLKVEGIDLDFEESGIREISKIAIEMNEKLENIGARRLHTIVEMILEDISFEGADCQNKNIKINSNFVKEAIKELKTNNNFKDYIL